MIQIKEGISGVRKEDKYPKSFKDVCHIKHGVQLGENRQQKVN